MRRYRNSFNTVKPKMELCVTKDFKSLERLGAQLGGDKCPTFCRYSGPRHISLYCVHLNSIGNTGQFASVTRGSVFGVFSERNLGCTHVRYQKFNCVDSHPSCSVCVSLVYKCVLSCSSASAARGNCGSFGEFPLRTDCCYVGLGARRVVDLI